jgi:hypothetical protein
VSVLPWASRAVTVTEPPLPAVLVAGAETLKWVAGPGVKVTVAVCRRPVRPTVAL